MMFTFGPISTLFPTVTSPQSRTVKLFYQLHSVSFIGVHDLLEVRIETIPNTDVTTIVHKKRRLDIDPSSCPAKQLS
jgi:hypothetical protein